MAKTKVKKVVKSSKKRTSRKDSGKYFYGVEHEFILVVGGGFLLVVLTSMIFVH